MCGFILVDEARRLFHVDIISEMSLKKSVIDVQLPEISVAGDSEIQNNQNSWLFDHMTVGVVEVNSRSLMITFCDEPGFTSLNCAISSSFNHVNPLAPN